VTKKLTKLAGILIEKHYLPYTSFKLHFHTFLRDTQNVTCCHMFNNREAQSPNLCIICHAS
jgi:hypothetical protein